jgi:hypothetical protein
LRQRLPSGATNRALVEAGASSRSAADREPRLEPQPSRANRLKH